MALPDIMSGPEIRQIFKIRTVQKQDVFQLNTFKAEEKNVYFQMHPNLDFLTPNLCP